MRANLLQSRRRTLRRCALSFNSEEEIQMENTVEVVAEETLLDLGAVSEATKGVYSPSSMECATNQADARDE
jgi:hypothetical protein